MMRRMMVLDPDAAAPTVSKPVAAEPVAAVGAPRSVTLAPSRPNPASGWTTIGYALPEAGTVSLDIFDVQGKRVSTLASGTFKAGEHTVTWNGRDEAGAPMPSGTYFYRLQAGQASLVRKLAFFR